MYKDNPLSPKRAYFQRGPCLIKILIENSIAHIIVTSYMKKKIAQTIFNQKVKY